MLLRENPILNCHGYCPPPLKLRTAQVKEIDPAAEPLTT